MLGVPVLAGSCAYAIAEAADWVGSLEVHPPLAHGFYAVIAVAMALGLGLDYAGLNAVKMLFWSAVAEWSTGATATHPGGAAHQQGRRNGRAPERALLRWLGWTCAGVMLMATLHHVRDSICRLTFIWASVT